MAQTVVQDHGDSRTEQRLNRLGVAETTPGLLILSPNLFALLAFLRRQGLGVLYLPDADVVVTYTLLL